ncbi:MAG: bifunctional 3-(3-hydroxy-phenyl)propionate/3-hydroxycinnamic acid hydroxylase [Nevskiales bacterium]
MQTAEDTSPDGIIKGSKLPTNTQVLIVGYGPVGATMACLLGRYGVDTVVIDRAAEMQVMPRAIGMDQEGLRIMQLAGLGEDDFEKLAMNKMHMVSPFFGRYASFNTAGIINGHARQVMYYQPDLERALRKVVSTHDSVQVFAQTEILNLIQSEQGVEVGLRGADGQRRVLTAQYVVGADGAASTVRDLIGLGFKGRSYAEDWLIVDAKRVPYKLRDVDFYCGPGRPGPHIPTVGDRQRWEFMLGPKDNPAEMEKPEKIRELLEPWCRAEDIEIERKAVYRFHARSCDRYSKGRVFLTGDAAHITPPFIGQGLVSGMRDVANLSWKLKWVLDGNASAAVLESYDTERRPHARAMINLAHFLGHWIMPHTRLKAFLVHGSVRLLRMLPVAGAWMDEAKLKKPQIFKRGLFRKTLPGKPGGRKSLHPGTFFPQGLVRQGNNIVLSDDALGDELCLVGFGFDPAQHLDTDSLAAWQASGGKVVQIARRCQYLDRSPDAIEDLTGVLVPHGAPDGWAAVVRPDKMVLHEGPVTESRRLVAESLELLQQAAGSTSSTPFKTTSAKTISAGS